MKASNQSGFTLIEIVLALGILAFISLFAINTLRDQIDTRTRLEVVYGAQHGVHIAMSRLVDDLRHAYITSKADAATRLGSLTLKPALLARSSARVWAFTTQSNRSFVGNSAEGNIAVVGYTLRQNPEDSSLTQLVRRLDTSMNDSLERGGVEQVLVPDVKNFKLVFWDGNDFQTEDWDTSSSATQGKLPKMIKVILEVYVKETEEEKQRKEIDPSFPKEKKSILLETIVYLMYTQGESEIKAPLKDFKWQ